MGKMKQWLDSDHENLDQLLETDMTKGLTKNGWDVMCNVSKVVIDVDKKVGELHLPSMNVPDMSSTINCFTSADPECHTIFTYVDGVADVIYAKTSLGWEARYVAR